MLFSSRSLTLTQADLGLKRVPPVRASFVGNPQKLRRSRLVVGGCPAVQTPRSKMRFLVQRSKVRHAWEVGTDMVIFDPAVKAVDASGSRGRRRLSQL